MLFRKSFRKDDVPELNTTSTADISFMLLILFLVTTSMHSNFGMLRQLPRPVPPEMEKEEMVVDRRNVFELMILTDGKVMKDDEEVRVEDLSARLRTFIMNPHHDATLAESPKEHIIMIRTAPDARYDTYFKVENQVVNAYKVVRNEAARKRFGKDYRDLTQRQTEIIDKMIPQRISEP